MERYINIKRTRMIDEASLGHRPEGVMGYLLKFILVFMIATLASSVLQSIPLVLYLLLKTDFFSLALKMAQGTISAEEYAEAGNEILNNLPYWFNLVGLFLTATSIVAAIFYCVKIEKRTVASMGLRKGNIGVEYLVGAIIGIAMYGLTFLIAYATGSVSIRLNPEGFAPIIIVFLLGYIIQGASEEILVRGYLMISVAKDYRLWLSIVFSSVVFSLLHAGNASVGLLALVNITLFGIFEAIYICKRGNIWGACAIHSMWNFVQGNIFGSNVSGNALSPSLFIMEYDSTKTIANGGAFGLEGGAATTIVILVAIGIVLLLKTKESELSPLEKPMDIKLDVE